MKYIFQQEIQKPDNFVVTLELVPGAESRGRSVDTVMSIAEDARSDGRIAAVTITDNPGGNPSLSPDALGSEIFKLGMDVIVHFTCRDLNRAGIESRALQLSRLNITNILALNGDYSAHGFGGHGAPVFDLDSVNLLCLFRMLSKRLQDSNQGNGFFTGCAVSPFKSHEGECFAQYYKLCKKAGAGAGFIITQLGYDAGKFQELIQIQKEFSINLPILGSVYFLTPKMARIMNQGKVPGAVVTDDLLKKVDKEWATRDQGREAAAERCARLAAVLKGLGYKGIHIGGIHQKFGTVARILDRFDQIEQRWPDFVPKLNFPQKNGYYVFARDQNLYLSSSRVAGKKAKPPAPDRVLFHLLRKTHDVFFNFQSPLHPYFSRVCAWLQNRVWGRFLVSLIEDPSKKVLLSCIKCGDCAIQHLAFLCPETQCPKHIRNGACGGSRNGNCEVYPDRPCVWVRAYQRLAVIEQTRTLGQGCVPPRRWELNKTSSWCNFHFYKDHQSTSCSIAQFCGLTVCSLKKSDLFDN